MAMGCQQDSRYGLVRYSRMLMYL